MKKFLFSFGVLSVLALSSFADDLPRFIDIKVFRDGFDQNQKKGYLLGAVDMFYSRIGTQLGYKNKLFKCTENLNLNDFLIMFNNFLKFHGNKYDDHSAAEIFTLMISQYCKS